jgi:hypothetical protein
VLTRHLLALTVAVFAPLAISACGGQTNVSRASGQCSEQIILSLAPGFGRTGKVIKTISRGADVQLEYLRSSSPALHVYKLTTEGKDPGCRNALARLRQDSHVRFAEPDGRRSHYDAAAN